jgi:hypothetical protein
MAHEHRMVLEEDGMDAITDIWFYTAHALPDLGHALGLTDINYDHDNYWEWITGDLLGVALDSTRTHTILAAETPTRIFRLGHPPTFTPMVIELLVQRIKGVGVAPIMLGSWIYRSGNTFDQRLDHTIR